MAGFWVPHKFRSTQQVPRIMLEALSDRPQAGLWLDRYHHPLPIRSCGALHLVSTLRSGDERACVVVVPGPQAARARVEEVFAEVERVHRGLDHPRIARVAARGVAGEVPYLELDCEAVIDGMDVLCTIAAAGDRMPFSAADALLAGLHEALASTARMRDPRTGGLLGMGPLSYANILLARSGAWHLVGFGRELPRAADRAGQGSPKRPVALPAAAPPIGDCLALLLRQRSLVADVGGEPTMTAALVVGPEATWIAGSDGARQRLGRSLRRIVLALLARHRSAERDALGMWDLLAAGWPEERPVPTAGANRVYAAVARLRRMGMRDVLERFEDGYRIAPRAAIRFVDA